MESVNVSLEISIVRFMFSFPQLHKELNMAAPRQTFQQRLFADDELPLQSHDKIVRWADKALRENASAFLRALDIPHDISGSACVGWGAEVVWDGLDGHDRCFSAPLRSLARRYAPKRPEPPIIETAQIVWEPILKDERGTVLGAVDLLAALRIPYPEFDISSRELGFESQPLKAELASKIPEDAKFLFWDGQRVWIDDRITKIEISGQFPDSSKGVLANKTSARSLINADYSSNIRYKQIWLYVEAKTKIRSIGELLRQLNLYRSIARSGSRFLVVAPPVEWDHDMKSILREQGIATVDYLAN